MDSVGCAVWSWSTLCTKASCVINSKERVDFGCFRRIHWGLSLHCFCLFLHRENIWKFSEPLIYHNQISLSLLIKLTWNVLKFWTIKRKTLKRREGNIKIFWHSYAPFFMHNFQGEKIPNSCYPDMVLFFLFRNRKRRMQPCRGERILWVWNVLSMDMGGKPDRV